MRTVFLSLVLTAITLVASSRDVLAGCGIYLQALGPTELCAGDSVVLHYDENQHCDGMGKRWYKDGVVIPYMSVFNWSSEITVFESGVYEVKGPGNHELLVVNFHNPVELEQPFFVEDSGLLTSNHLGFHYRWLFNGTELVDATADTLRITAAGEYQLMLSDLLGCFSYSSSPITVTEDYLASLQPEPLVLVPILFPIPNAGNFTLMYAFPAGSAALFELLDATGRHIDSFYLEGERDQWEFSCPHLANGIYHYKVFLNGTVVKTERLVVSR